MSDRLSKLLQSYSSHISIPWSQVISAEERAIFVVYHKEDELKLRARLPEFEEVTRQAGHPWINLDVTHAFPQWMAKHDYREAYFEDPEFLEGSYGYFADELVEQLTEQYRQQQSADSVVALIGCGALFGFASVSGLVKALSTHIQGRLVVFFPGEHYDNTYRLLDAKDGWGYQATAITAL